MGVKLFAFSRRREGATPEEFHGYWRDVHARQIADEPTLRRHVRRYELRTTGSTSGAAFDGVTEQWFTSFDTFVDSLSVEAVDAR